MAKNPFAEDANLLSQSDVDPFHQDPQSQLEFQNFMLSSAEEELLAGKIPSKEDETGFSFKDEPIPLSNAQPQQNSQSRGNGLFWTFEFWKSYFNIDTKDVFLRMSASLNPTSSFMTHIGSNPDFYGPLWIPTTVIFLLFATSTVAISIDSLLAGQSKSIPLDVTTLSWAVATVYSYVVALPTLIYFIAKYYKAESVSLFDLINVYGYGMTIWIPISLLCVFPSSFLRWIFVIGAFAVSTLFLLRTIQPMTANLNSPTATTIILCSICVAQFGLSLLFKLKFFEINITTEKPPSQVAIFAYGSFMRQGMIHTAMNMHPNAGEILFFAFSSTEVKNRMVKVGTIYGYQGPNIWKSQIAAKYNQLELDFKAVDLSKGEHKKPEFLSKFPLGKIPTFEDPEGFYLNESDAIAFYVASQKENSLLVGKTKKESALINSFVQMATNEFSPISVAWLYPLKGYAAYSEEATKTAKSNAGRVMKVLNAHLATRTFLVGDRVTLADIIWVCILANYYQHVFDPTFVAEFTNVTRWFTTCVNQKQFSDVMGKFEFCKKAAVYDPKATPNPKKEKAPSAKKEKKEPVEDLEAIAALEEKPKAKNPLDLLPKSSFILDEWKRFYSNNDTRPTAVDWFWKNYDPTGYSIWKVDYKYNDELTQVFMSSNLIGGVFQRLESARKYAFGSMLVLGENGKNKITGYFVLRGLELPFEVKDSADYESFKWTKVSDKDAKIREQINAVFAWDEKIDGLVCADGKTFK